jgi:hypothetical protein
MSTYSANADLKFDTGRSLTDLLDEDLSADDYDDVLRRARERAFNFINSRLEGKTAIPANHINSLKQVEIDLCLSDILSSAFTMETSNTSDWVEKYKERATSVLDNLSYDASAEDPKAKTGNTGNGRMRLIGVNGEYTKTERIIFNCIDANTFRVFGSVNGRLPDLLVDSPYPDPQWTSGGQVSDYGLLVPSHPSYEAFPFYVRLNSGSEDFVEGDMFTMNLYASSRSKMNIAVGKIMRA